mgnify:CR=1 FL=1
MLRAIFYKEWLKTRWYYLVAVLLSLGFVGYVLLNFFRAAGLKGIAHLWEVMLLRDAVFVDLLQFVPLVVGLLFAVVQFVPEMQRKCLKLTLHLPCPELRMIGAMLLYGVLLLGALFAVSLGVLFVAFRAVLAPELVRHILLTAAPWYAAGLSARGVDLSGTDVAAPAALRCGRGVRAEALLSGACSRSLRRLPAVVDALHPVHRLLVVVVGRSVQGGTAGLTNNSVDIYDTFQQTIFRLHRVRAASVAAAVGL